MGDDYHTETEDTFQDACDRADTEQARKLKELAKKKESEPPPETNPGRGYQPRRPDPPAIRAAAWS